jgi:hypothetical protein
MWPETGGKGWWSPMPDKILKVTVKSLWTAFDCCCHSTTACLFVKYSWIIFMISLSRNIMQFTSVCVEQLVKKSSWRVGVSFDSSSNFCRSIYNLTSWGCLNRILLTELCTYHKIYSEPSDTRNCGESFVALQGPLYFAPCVYSHYPS